MEGLGPRLIQTHILNHPRSAAVIVLAPDPNQLPLPSLYEILEVIHGGDGLGLGPRLLLHEILEAGLV